MLLRHSAPLRDIAPEVPPLAHNSLERQNCRVDAGDIAYLRYGEGPPLLLVHGIPTSCRLWEPLLGVLGNHFDCIVPDLLGLGHSAPADDDVDVSSPGQADMLAQLLDALDIDHCGAVFHDQGGAHGMQMLKRHGQRINAVLFTNCVCYDNWPVPLIDFSATLGRLGLVPVMSKLRLMQTTLRTFFPMTLGRRAPFPRALLDDWFRALNTGGQPLRDWTRYVTNQSNKHSLDAVDTLRAWDKPAQVLWAADDRFLPVSWGIRLARDLCGEDAQPLLMPFAGHFWQAEVADTGARAIADFFRKAD